MSKRHKEAVYIGVKRDMEGKAIERQKSGTGKQTRKEKKNKYGWRSKI